jgi:thiol-disulfide isomerase/thioredoxin
MNTTLRLLAIFALVFALVPGAAAGDKPDKALCLVCAVRGETEPEKVEAEAEYEGKWYYFCSKDCRKEFLIDPVGYIPAELPRPAPSFVVESLDGVDVPSEFEGKVTLIDFWATWCKPCAKIMPGIQKLHDRYRDGGFEVMGISIDEDEDRAELIEKYLHERDITYPVFTDTKRVPAWYTYRVKAVPAAFLVDRSGRIVAEWRGAVDHEELEREVARLMADAGAE